MTELNEKVVKYLHRKLEQFRYHFSLVVPFEYIHQTSKSLEDTYKTAMFRLDSNTSRLQEIIFYGRPFKIESSR